MEIALTFAGSNSPRIFRLIARFLEEAVEIEMGVYPQLNTMLLDDLYSERWDDILYSYFNKYREWSVRMRIELAGLHDPGKAFGTCQR